MRFAGLITMAVLLSAGAVLAAEIPRDQRRSGYSFMGPDTRAMQDDDTANPGMLWVLDGETLWKRKTGAADKACADCHNDARASMKGVAARYPAHDKALGRPVDLEQRINLCRANHQQASPLPYESRDLLALTAFIAQQSRGLPIEPAPTPRSRRSSPGAAISSWGARASSISAAAIAMTIIGTSIWRDRRSRRLIRRAIRSTGWNGNRWARCSGDCGVASPASGRRPMITVRPNWSSWNSI
jgi:hypothetical protein